MACLACSSPSSCMSCLNRWIESWDEKGLRLVHMGLISDDCGGPGSNLDSGAQGSQHRMGGWDWAAHPIPTSTCHRDLSSAFSCVIRHLSKSVRWVVWRWMRSSWIRWVAVYSLLLSLLPQSCVLTESRWWMPSQKTVGIGGAVQVLQVVWPVDSRL